MTAGRPPKFDEPSSPVTVTLPSRILKQLKKIDDDRGKAIVKCVEEITAATGNIERKSVEIIKISEDAGLIVIGPCRCLQEISWLRLVEISPARFILSVLPGTNVTSLEVALMDLIEHGGASDDYERSLLEELRQCISHHRRQEIVTKGEILFLKLDKLKKKTRDLTVAISLQVGLIELFQSFPHATWEEILSIPFFC